MAPRLDPLKAVLAKLDPPARQPEAPGAAESVRCADLGEPAAALTRDGAQAGPFVEEVVDLGKI